jgi:hypothetical protein
LLQWKHRCLLPDGDLNEASAHCAIWLGEMTRRGIAVGKAFELYSEGIRGVGSILLLTVDGPMWLSDDAYKKKLITHFKDGPFFFAISFRHWFEKASNDLVNFERVMKFREKINMPTERELVH